MASKSQQLCSQPPFSYINMVKWVLSSADTILILYYIFQAFLAAFQCTIFNGYDTVSFTIENRLWNESGCTACQKHKKANRIKRFWIFFLCRPLLFISKYKTVRCERFRAFSFRFIKLSEGRNLFCKCETGRCWYARRVFQFYTLICTCTWRILCFYSCMSHVLLFRIKMLTEKKKQTDFIAT